MPSITHPDNTAPLATRTFQLGIKTIEVMRTAEGLWRVNRYIWPSSILAAGEPTFHTEAEAMAAVEKASGRSLRPVGAPVAPAPALPATPVRLKRPVRAPEYPFAAMDLDPEPRPVRPALRPADERPREPVRRLAPASTPTPAVEPEITGTRRERMDAHRHLLGTASDSNIANRAHVTENYVREYRLSVEKSTVTKTPKTTKATPTAKDLPVVGVPVPTQEPAPRSSKLDAFRHVLGTLPDAEVALLAGVNRKTVVIYRQAHDIAACPRGRGAKAPEAPAERSAVEAPAPVRASQPRTSKLDTLHDVLGVLSDGEVAALSGLSRKTVMLYRQADDIPARPRGRPAALSPAPVDEHVTQAPTPLTARAEAGAQVAGASREEAVLSQQESDIPSISATRSDAGLAPSVEPVEVAAPVAGPNARARGASKLDSYRGILGVERDSVVATLAGVTDEAVRQYRVRFGIEATWKKHTKAVHVPLPIKPADDEPAGAATLPPDAGSVSAAPAVVAADRAGADVEQTLTAATGPPRVHEEPARPRKASRLDAYLDIVGVLSDAEVAAKAGYTANGVAKYRVARGIEAAPPRPRGRRKTEEPAITAAPEVKTVAAQEPVRASATVEPAAPVEPAEVAASAPVAGAVDLDATSVPEVLSARESTHVAPVEPDAGTAPVAPEDGPDLRGYYVTAAKGDQEKRWLIVGRGMADAMLRATRALQPGWRLVKAKEIGVDVLA